MVNQNFKVHVEPVQYVVNEDKKAVVCITEVYLDTPMIDSNNYSASFYNEMYRERVVGVAKCSPNDTFDVEIGKQIAYARAENKAYAIAKAYVARANADIAAMKSICDKFIDKASYCIEHNNEYIDALTNTENPAHQALIEKRKNKVAKTNI